jgi:transposase-like protein
MGRVTRKCYSAEFKARVALEAIEGEQTVSELASKHGVHVTMINGWKRQAVDGLAGIFGAKAKALPAATEADVTRLHAKIGQLVVERFFCEGLRSMTVERRRAIMRPDHATLSIVRQCALLSISRSGLYCEPTAESAGTLALIQHDIAELTADCRRRRPGSLRRRQKPVCWRRRRGPQNLRFRQCGPAAGPGFVAAGFRCSAWRGFSANEGVPLPIGRKLSSRVLMVASRRADGRHGRPPGEAPRQLRPP